MVKMPSDVRVPSDSGCAGTVVDGVGSVVGDVASLPEVQAARASAMIAVNATRRCLAEMPRCPMDLQGRRWRSPRWGIEIYDLVIDASTDILPLDAKSDDDGFRLAPYPLDGWSR